MYCISCDLAIFKADSILDPILDPPGHRFRSFLAPKMVETCLEIRFGPPKSGSRLLFFGSEKQKRGFQKRVQILMIFRLPGGQGSWIPVEVRWYALGCAGMRWYALVWETLPQPLPPSDSPQ